jgi:hypothetical protein
MDTISGSKKQYADANQIYFGRYTVITPIWGFMDDIFIQASSSNNLETFQVFAQGQLRIGKGDMDKNLKTITSFYECIN